MVQVSRGSHDEQGEEGGGRAWVEGAEAGTGKREGVESRGGYRAARDGGEEFGEAKGGFLSGAAWVGKKAVAIVDEMGEEVRSFVLFFKKITTIYIYLEPCSCIFLFFSVEHYKEPVGEEG
jgi:hypothetical protein